MPCLPYDRRKKTKLKAAKQLNEKLRIPCGDAFSIEMKQTLVSHGANQD